MRGRGCIWTAVCKADNISGREVHIKRYSKAEKEEIANNEDEIFIIKSVGHDVSQVKIKRFAHFVSCPLVIELFMLIG